MILHLDLDSFFVSAHRTKDNSLLNKPVVVGGRSDPFIFDKGFNKTKVQNQNSGAFVPTLFIRDKEASFEEYFKEGDRLRGIVITASYEARSLGIKTGMSIREALSLCKELIVLTPTHKLYHDFSKRLKDFLYTKIPIIEQYSIDEFFADVGGWVEDDEVKEFAKEIKASIYQEFGLPISIGIAKTKWIAKFATSFAKPDGVKLILPQNLDKYLKQTPIEKFPGIGRSFTKKLHSYKKFTLWDIKTSKSLLYSFGRGGEDIYKRVCGEDDEKVIPNRPRKSIGISRTFDPIDDRDELKRRVIILSRHLVFMVSKYNYSPTTLHLSIRYEYAKSKKQITFNRIFNEVFFIKRVLKLFNELDIYKHSKVIRLSISLRNFTKYPKEPYSLFEYEKDRKFNTLLKQTTKMREKYGIDIIRVASEI